MKRLIILVNAIFALLLLSSCTTSNNSVPMNMRWANIEGSQLNSATGGEQFYFSFVVDDGMIKDGAPIKISVSGDVRNGSIRFELRDPDGQSVWNSGTINPGDFDISSEYDLATARTGTYTLGLVYSDNISATYNLSWEALKLSPIILVPGIGMILVALAFVIYAVSRRILGWRYLILGAVFWIVTVIAKFAFAIPVNPLVYRLLKVPTVNLFSPANLVFSLYVGALTGIFEVGLAYVILRRFRWGRASWNQALVFGIGFGIVEALLLGFSGLGSALVAVFSPDVLPVPTLGNLATNTSLIMGLAPVVERLSVIFAHIFACVLIFYAIAKGEKKWVLYSILYKTLLDTPAAFASFWGVNTAGKIWTIEAIIFVIGLVGLWGAIQVARKYPKTPQVVAE